jgi:hypothetical protein
MAHSTWRRRLRDWQAEATFGKSAASDYPRCNERLSAQEQERADHPSKAGPLSWLRAPRGSEGRFRSERRELYRREQAPVWYFVR